MPGFKNRCGISSSKIQFSDALLEGAESWPLTADKHIRFSGQRNGELKIMDW
jgi:hypothetical protein